MHFLGYFYQYYYLVLVLQAVCVFHCIRKGNSYQWIWLIVFLPAIGGLIYLFSEIITKRDVESVKNNLDTVIRPSGRVRDLEKQVDFSDTFENRIALADAYLENGRYDDAIRLYTADRTGLFEKDPHLNLQLIRAFSATEKYEEVIQSAQLIMRHPDFQKAHEHVLYALALEKTGKLAEAEAELAAFGGKYSNFEGRYHYGCFLKRNGRNTEAKQIFEDILQSGDKMTRREAAPFRHWIRMAQDELKQL